MKFSGDNLDSTIEWRSLMLVTAQAIGLLAMIGATWRLWFPVISREPNSTELIFPGVPVFGFLATWSPVLSWVISIGLICFVGLGLFSTFKCCRSLSRPIVLCVLVMLVINVCLDQHRFLPWAWQSMLMFAGFGLLRSREFLRYARVLFVSIYVWSAISKLDYQFVKTTGREFLHTLTGFVGVDSSNWLEPWTDLIVLGFPVAELLIGIGLMFGATRLVAMFGAMCMHLTLVLILGPLGLDNAESVLIWNLQFVFQLFLLYWPVRRSTQTEPAAVATTGVQKITFVGLAIFVGVFPLLEKFNVLDHWPAWGLYSPQASRCRLWVPEWKVQTLPAESQGFFKAAGSGPARIQEFDLARWSIKRLNAPIYPQDRFQYSLALHLVVELKLERTFLIELQSASNYWTGRRNVKKYSDLVELQSTEDQFWGNTITNRPGKVK